MKKVCMWFFCHLYSKQNFWCSAYDVKITPLKSVILAAYKISINPFTAMLASLKTTNRRAKTKSLFSFFSLCISTRKDLYEKAQY